MTKPEDLPIRWDDDIRRIRHIPRWKPQPVPDTSIFDSPYHCAIINQKWVAHVIGVLDVLSAPDMWDSSDSEVERALQEIEKFMRALSTPSECTAMITNIRTNGCNLEAQFNSDEWVVVGDISSCAVPGDPGAPGADGEDGREIELAVNGAWIQWRYVGDSTWNNLILVDDLKGEQGLPGAPGVCTCNEREREIELLSDENYCYMAELFVDRILDLTSDFLNWVTAQTVRAEYYADLVGPLGDMFFGGTPVVSTFFDWVTNIAASTIANMQADLTTPREWEFKEAVYCYFKVRYAVTQGSVAFSWDDDDKLQLVSMIEAIYPNTYNIDPSDAHPTAAAIIASLGKLSPSAIPQFLAIWSYGESINCNFTCAGDTWEHVFDFTASDGGFARLVPANDDGIWVSGTGWVAQAYGGGSLMGIRIGRTINTTTITYAELVIHDLQNRSYGNLFRLRKNGSNVYSDIVLPSSQPVINIERNIPDVECDEIIIAYPDSTQTYTYAQLTLRGTGTNPFI